MHYVWLYTLDAQRRETFCINYGCVRERVCLCDVDKCLLVTTVPLTSRALSGQVNVNYTRVGRLTKGSDISNEMQLSANTCQLPAN